MSDVSAASTVRRRPWLAGLLSLLLPGLGQFYNGDLRLALVLLIGTSLAAPAGIWLIAALPAQHAPVAAWVFVVTGVLLCAFAVTQAVLRARRLESGRLARFQRWYVYVGIFIAAVVWRGGVELLPIAAIDSYSMPSASMLPTLLVGDHHVARTRAFVDRAPERGELVIFKSPADGTTDLIKRIVGLSGDRIQMREGRLYINDVVVERARIEDFRDQTHTNPTPLPQYIETLPGGASYRIIEAEGDSSMLDDTPVFTVPVDHVFMLGDNRDFSIDSRTELGPVPIDLLRDKPLFLFWAVDLGRIGKVLE